MTENGGGGREKTSEVTFTKESERENGTMGT